MDKMENKENVMDDSPSESKRKRSSNWTEEDKILLKDLVKEKVHAVENKNTDTNTNNNKKRAWLWIEESFNNMCSGSKRTLTQLKSQWIVTKMNAKKEISNYHKEVKKTGGGPQPPALVLSENDIAVWLPNEFVIDTNEFDSDAVFGISPPVEKSSQEEKQAAETLIMSNGAKDLQVEEAEIQIISEGPKDLSEDVVPTKNKKKKKHVIYKSVADEQIKEVAKYDIECSKELHRLQVLNEEKKKSKS